MVGFGVFLFLFFGMPGRNLKKMAQHCCVVAGEEDKEYHFEERDLKKTQSFFFF